MHIWTPEERKLLAKLKSPGMIQDFLDGLKYNDLKKNTKSPRQVMRDLHAHCFDGALFAAAALRQMGHEPLVVDLRAVNDDDHVLAVYKRNGLWGSIAKSNFVILRSREPVYKSIRELCMSYFDFYFNTLGEKTLREYSVPVNLRRFDKINWMTTEENLEDLGNEIDKVRHFFVVDKKMEKKLAKVNPTLVQAGLIGADKRGLFHPETEKS